jgi:4-amino-4-deoxy-L-arabinose transferase-like glycosyltransferase
MANTDSSGSADGSTVREKRLYYLALILVAVSIHVACIVSPPSLSDDVDGVQAQIARNMLSSGDWVTARLDGVPYLEKAPLIYWLIAGSYQIFGVHDWSARIPLALACVGLCWLTMAFGHWAFGLRAGFYAGVCMATCVGLFLFTRILIPDVMLTFTIALALWALMRALEEQEAHPRFWSIVLAASLGTGLLLKSLIAVLFPIAAGAIYLFFTRQLFSKRTWARLHPFTGLLIIAAIAAPWHILATVRNPPYFDVTLRSVPGEYHGFFWFYFINEQLLRFLNLRYPRDYNTVPRLYFWLFHLLWLFPWSVYFPAVAKLSFRPTDRAGQTRLMALCWIGFVMVFFTFSTTQEYYSMPCYTAMALLLGSAMATDTAWVHRGTRVLTVMCGLAAAVSFILVFLVWNLSTPGDISVALTKHPEAYTLSLGHIEDLTLSSLAYLRLPLLVAAIAFLLGAVGTIKVRGHRAFLAATVMMVVFYHAAKLALIVFDPFLSSRPLVTELEKAPHGDLVIDHHYYTFSTVFFYTNRTAYLLNGRFNNLVYGSYAPGAPDVFLDNAQFKARWMEPRRCYIVAKQEVYDRLATTVAPASLTVVARSGGKMLLTNLPL